MNIKTVSVSKEILEKSNPVFTTARMCLFQLASIGDADAIRLLKATGFGAETQMVQGAAKLPDEILYLNNITFEARYYSVMNFARESGIKNFVDLPCGYTPRVLKMIDQGIDFYGLDLPAVAEEIRPVIDAVTTPEQKNHYQYHGVDATNYASLDHALKDVDGEILISTEGMLSYLTDGDIEAFVQNIARLLKKHGGYWITTDATEAQKFMMLTGTIFGERAREIGMMMKEFVSKKSNIGVDNNVFSQGREQEALALLKKNGLSMELKSYYDYLPEMTTLKKFDEPIAMAVKEVMKQINIWVVSLDENLEDDSEVNDVQKIDFRMESEISDEKVEIILHGRLDSISAPQLLAYFERNADAFSEKEVVINRDDVTYVSSAGERVLRMIIGMAGLLGAVAMKKK